jgi:hypothetical protein
VLLVSLDQVFVLLFFKYLGQGFLVFVVVFSVGFSLRYSGQQNLGVGRKLSGSSKIEIEIEDHFR